MDHIVLKYLDSLRPLLHFSYENLLRLEKLLISKKPQHEYAEIFVIEVKVLSNACRHLEFKDDICER